MPEIRTQNIGDVDVQYLLYEGDGPTIIFLHATGFMPWIWHPIARRLAASYRIIAPYFCDHRERDPEEGGLGWMLLAEDLCSLCTRLRIESPLLVGHSMGATVMTLANATHGSLARKMILIEPIFLPSDFYGMKIKVADHPLASKSIKRKNHWENAESARSYLKSRRLFKNWDDEILDIYITYGMIRGETGGLQLACHPRREASLFMGGLEFNPWPLLPHIHCPVLVVEGEESENRKFIDLQKASTMMPKGEFMRIGGAGHLIPMERPAEITEIITGYFSRNDHTVRA